MRSIVCLVSTDSFCVLSLKQTDKVGGQCRHGHPPILPRKKNYLSDQLKLASGDGEAIDFSKRAVLDAMEPFLVKSRENRDRTLQENVYSGFLSLEHVFSQLGTLRLERKITFNFRQYPFIEEFVELLFGPIKTHNLSALQSRLSCLHTDFCDGVSKADKRDDKLMLMGPLLDRVRRQNFHEVFDDFVRNFILPNLEKEMLGFPSHAIDIDTFYYQCFPCVRIVRPGEFSIGIHADCIYGHHPGNINFYLPLTDIKGTNSLVLESFPGEENWHALELSYGEICRFHGAVCNHFTPENTTQCSRVSFDFRVLPGNVYEASHDQYVSEPGYYVKSIKDRKSGLWLRENHEAGLYSVVDWRCGFPFTNQ